LFLEEATAKPSIIRRPMGLARPWLNPSLHAEVAALDFGAGKMFLHFLRAGKDIVGVPFDQVIRLIKSLLGGTALICESAHMGRPQTDKSLAQPFTEQQLMEIYRVCEERGITLLLFPHQHTRKAREWAAANCEKGFIDEEKTDDINDARAIAFYVGHNNGVSLAKPLSSFSKCDRREYGRLVREFSNVTLNAARVRGYDGEVFGAVSKIADRVLNAVGTKNGFFNNKKAAFSLASLVAGEVDGMPVRFTYEGRSLGFSSFRTYVAMWSPHHFRGGVARSNLLWHRFRPFLAETCAFHGSPVKNGMKYIPHGQFSVEQEALKRFATKQMRDELKEAYGVAVERSADFEPYEILDLVMISVSR
jgi:hypothetical protein